MKRLKLTKGKYTLLDDEDFERASRYRWFCDYFGYAARDFKINGKRKRVWLHRWLFDVPKGLFIDHKNRNPLDNRRSNLRICTNQQNVTNGGIPKNNTSGYKGVSFAKEKGRWRAYIKYNRKQIWLGYFDDPKKAARAYNQAARRYHGQFACLNPI